VGDADAADVPAATLSEFRPPNKIDNAPLAYPVRTPRAGLKMFIWMVLVVVGISFAVYVGGKKKARRTEIDPADEPLLETEEFY
jgi:hypothetical protein